MKEHASVQVSDQRGRSKHDVVTMVADEIVMKIKWMRDQGEYPMTDHAYAAARTRYHACHRDLPYTVQSPEDRHKSSGLTIITPDMKH